MATDRLSSLTDEIICQILSFLPTKQAVSTSVLSKRWIHLWRFVPVLDFSNTSLQLNLVDYYRFNELVLNILFERELADSRSIHTFILNIEYLSNQVFYHDHRCITNINKWINYAGRCKVQYLNLFIHPYNYFENRRPQFPISILNCTTLVILNLRCFAVYNIVPFKLPTLKTLHLKDIYFDQRRDFMLLLDGCPVLEDLQLSNIHFNKPYTLRNVNGFQSSSMLRKLNFPSLKTLHLKDIYFDQQRNFMLLLVDGCPVLEDLQLSNIYFNEPYALNYVNGFRSSSMLRKLNKADITACDCYFLVEPLTNLKFLRIQLPLRYHHDFPTFHYLTHLVLKNDPDIVVKVLQHCPKLQNLELYQKLQGDNQQDTYIARDYNLHNWPDREVVPSCLTLNLRNCTIRDFEFPGVQRFDIILARYILKNAKVLETMTIRWWNGKRFIIEKKLHQCPRASATCQLSIY